VTLCKLQRASRWQSLGIQEASCMHYIPTACVYNATASYSQHTTEAKLSAVPVDSLMMPKA
jgi:hypothetical protein